MSLSLKQLGQVVQTRGVAEAAKNSSEFYNEVQKAFNRYLACDWGDLCQEDKDTNTEALENGDRLLAAYDTSKGKLYIITEWDRSYTTILFADEY